MSSRLTQLARHLTKPIMASTLDRFKLPIRTAGCLIIGDEILNGKTVDTNSAYFAKYCFSLGISLKRIEVIADDESEIIEAARRMSASYDLVVTSGGIGPTHDDITYLSLSRAFAAPLALHTPTAQRMRELSKDRQDMKNFDWDTPSATLTARMRMATLPVAEHVRNLFVTEDAWVPICVVNYNVHVLPGVPKIFVQLLDGLRVVLEEEGRLSGTHETRVMISTPLPESEVAEFLTELQERVKDKGVKVGSYPRWGKKRNTVTLVGEEEEVEKLVEEVERKVKGLRVGVEGADDMNDAEEEAGKGDGADLEQKPVETEKKGGTAGIL